MPEKKKRNGKVVGYVARVRRHGINKSRLCDTKDEAKQQESEWIQQIERQLNKATPTVLEWLTHYLDYCQAQYTAKTYEEKREAAAIVYHYIGKDLEVPDISPGDVLQTLRLVADRRSGHAANKVRKNLIAAWNWGQKYLDNFSSNNPFHVDKFKEQKQERYVPPMEDVQAVLDMMPEDDQTMLLCYLHTGARRDEIFRLRWEDIDFANSKLTLWTRKRKSGTWEPDTIPMTSTLREALLRKRKDSTGTGLVFTWSGRKYKFRRHWLDYWCGLAGVPRFTFHSIRHLTASWLDAHNVPLTTIQAILRHKSATTTAKYLHELRGVQADLDSVFEGKRDGRVLNINKASTGTSDGG